MSNEAGVRAELLRQECDVLKEAKISLNSEIRNMIREKNQYTEELKELKVSLKAKQGELRQFNDDINKSNRKVAKAGIELQAKKEEHSELITDIDKRNMELAKIIQDVCDREGKIGEKEKDVEDKLLIVNNKIEKINQILNICQ